MEEDAPLWLTREFLTVVLKNGENKNNDIKILQFEVKPAVAPGNNYTSHMYRVSVEYEIGHLSRSSSLMVKIPITDGFINELSEKYDFFSKEPQMYNELLPSMVGKTSCAFGPRAYHCPIEKGLVLEDLKIDGYQMCDKSKQCDYSHCKLVLIKLAKFHAASVSLHQERPHLVEKVGEEFLFTENSRVSNMANSAIRNISNILGSMEECKVFKNYLDSRMDHIWKKVTKLTQPKTSGLNVLNHGDLWMNNMMFKYKDNGDVADVKFVDFQIARFASPANDLLYFIWTSARADVRGSELQKLHKIYLETFNKTLEELGCTKTLSMNELETDLKLSVDWALLIICQFLPIMMSESEFAPDFSKLSSEDFETEKYLQVYNGKIFRLLLSAKIKNFTEFFLL